MGRALAGVDINASTPKSMCVARNRADELFVRVLPFAVVRGAAVDPLLQNSGRLEHHDLTRGNRQLGSLRIAADAPAFLGILLQGSVSLPSRIPGPYLNAHRGTGMRPRITHPFMKTMSFDSPRAAPSIRFPSPTARDENTEQKRDQQ